MTIPVTVLIVAKAPVPGLAKTRLAAALGDEVAAGIAAAALLDTLDAVATTPVTHRVVALTGDLTEACHGAQIRNRLSDFVVIDQRGESFADRLANAHLDAAAAMGAVPVLQIGMDTPQVSAELLTECAQALLDLSTVLGPACDGGWWVLGVTDASTACCLRDVPMSRPDTGALTLEALAASGSPASLLPELPDVDTVADIPAIRSACRPSSRFARATRSV